MLPLCNQLSLIGRAGHRPELRLTTNGIPQARLKLYQDASPAERHPQLHYLVAWRGVAEQLYQQIRRGDRILLQGRLVYRFVDRNGQAQRRTEVHLSAFTVLERPGRQPSTATADSTSDAASVSL
jgi:single-strand DNA-binding protein